MSCIPLEIEQVGFSVLGSNDYHQLAIVQCQDPLSRSQGITVMHPALGPLNKSDSCYTCDNALVDCFGHYGVIRLQMPVFNVGFLTYIIRLLHVLCKSCGRLLLIQERIRHFAHRFSNSRGLEFSQRKGLLLQVLSEARKTQLCPHCKAWNGRVFKAKGMAFKLVHEPFVKPGRRVRVELRHDFELNFAQAAKMNPRIGPHLKNAQQDLTPDVVLELFQKTSMEDCIALDMAGPHILRNLILQDVHVPPSCVRPAPPPNNAGIIRQDDLTTALNDIIGWSDEMKKHLLAGGTSQRFLELWDNLQVNVARYIDDSLPHFPKNLRDKGPGPLLSLVSRIKGKAGRFRRTLSGKRVNFSGRSVISPDPNLDIAELAVPLQVAKILTYPQRVYSQNIEILRKLVRRGPDMYPGANFVYFKSRGEKRDLRSIRTDKTFVAQCLQEGDIVERHLLDGDAVIFNRQPSLHRLSMLAHRARVLPQRTLRFNECVCLPYNADFDGDEMNIHLPQTEEARVESLELMISNKNLINARNGSPVIAAMQDFLTGSYLLTRKNVFMDRVTFAQNQTHMLESNAQYLRHPVICKPMELWTGKQLFESLICPDPSAQALSLSFRSTTRFFSNIEREMCLKEGFVSFLGNEMISGSMDKSILGSGDRSKDSLFFALQQICGSEYASKCMGRLCRLTSRWLTNIGFSIGIEDVCPAPELLRTASLIIKGGYQRADGLINTFQSGILLSDPGCTVEDTVESRLTRVWSDVRESCGKLCKDSLLSTNPALVMAECGSKGSILNISQMVVCVGQQIVQEKRIQNFFQDRSTPHFPKYTRSAEARGFVQNSFCTGLTPTEFVFHTMAGREGLVQSAVKTAQTGYLGRRIMKVLEDLVVEYDGSVRNAAGMIIQFQYGEDGQDPMDMETGIFSVNFRALWIQLQAQAPSNISSHSSCLTPGEMKKFFDSTLQDDINKRCGAHFRNALFEFFNTKVDELVRFRTSIGLPGEVRGHTKQDMEKELLIPSDLFVTDDIVQHFFATCVQRYFRKVCQPGTPCGVIAAQSLSEPTTQMTLRTFHFAGVAGMSVTQGVPRIEEIMDARKKISTPIVTVHLENSSSEIAARILKGRIERTTLRDILLRVQTVITPHDVFLSLTLCLDTISKLQLGINATDVARSLVQSSKTLRLQLSTSHIRVMSRDTLHVKPVNLDREQLLYNLDHIRHKLGDVIVAGLSTCSRAVISNVSKTVDKPCYTLMVETSDLLHLMGISGVCFERTTSNHITNVESVLGIEAARRKIIEEIAAVMNVYGLTIDPRHTMLLADAMTARGRVLGTTNVGMTKDRDSVLKLASFERTQEHLFQAALHDRVDKYMGVSESIILGRPPRVGTNMCSILYDSRPLVPCQCSDSTVLRPVVVRNYPA